MSGMTTLQAEQQGQAELGDTAGPKSDYSQGTVSVSEVSPFNNVFPN